MLDSSSWVTSLVGRCSIISLFRIDPWLEWWILADWIYYACGFEYCELVVDTGTVLGGWGYWFRCWSENYSLSGEFYILSILYDPLDMNLFILYYFYDISMLIVYSCFSFSHLFFQEYRSLIVLFIFFDLLLILGLKVTFYSNALLILLVSFYSLVSCSLSVSFLYPLLRFTEVCLYGVISLDASLRDFLLIYGLIYISLISL